MFNKSLLILKLCGNIHLFLLANDENCSKKHSFHRKYIDRICFALFTDDHYLIQNGPLTLHINVSLVQALV